MSDTPTLLYLEAADEITAVVRRVRAADPGRVVIVAPGRSRATSSVVALRLLARSGEDDGRELAIVGDALTRSLAAEAGLTAYASVDDARAATPQPDEASAPRHAAIHVIRGPATEETAPVPTVSADTETRPVAVVRPTAARAARSRRSRRAPPLVAVLAAAGILLLTAVVAAATILPAATIRITPRTDPVGPVPYRITITDPERTSGTVTETATVTATGTYPIQAAATGTVVLFNFNVVPVPVPAETLVAAGEQAFATVVGIDVPAGSLTSDGRIQAGEARVDVVAAAIGPGANVAAEAIATILDEGTRNRLRGFPQNNAPLVVNPEATAGGVDTTGVEITQADLDAAMASLREALDTGVTDALEGTGDDLSADAAEAPQPVITGAEELLGTRDQEQAEISGELAYDRLSVAANEVRDTAEARFAADADAVPTRVEIGEVRREGDALTVAVTVTGRSTAEFGRGEVIERVTGLSEGEARAGLAELGEATVDLWPGWVTSVPENDWRIEVQIIGGGS